MRYLERTGATVVWQARVSDSAYWAHAAGLPETTITITTAPGPRGRWVDIPKAAQKKDKYQVKCKHHECPGPYGLTDTYIHVHGQAKVCPEVQDAMQVLLAELYASNKPGDRCPEAEKGPVRLHAMLVQMGPRTYLEPRLEPGMHFHRLPDLATIRGYIMAWDAGNPSADDRKEAREVEELDDPRGMAAAIVQEEDGEVIEFTVEAVGVGRDPEHPLAHGPLLDGVPPDLAPPVDHLLVGEHGPQRRAPVHRRGSRAAVRPTCAPTVRSRRRPGATPARAARPGRR